LTTTESITLNKNRGREAKRRDAAFSWDYHAASAYKTGQVLYQLAFKKSGITIVDTVISQGAETYRQSPGNMGKRSTLRMLLVKKVSTGATKFVLLSSLISKEEWEESNATQSDRRNIPGAKQRVQLRKSENPVSIVLHPRFQPKPKLWTDFASRAKRHS